MATTDINRRVQKHRDALRSAGLRPIQIWVPDIRRPGFSKEVERQSKAVAEADNSDQDLQDFMDQALLDLDKDWEA